MSLHRTQLFLRPDQHAELARIAQREERTVSEVLREVLDEWIEGCRAAQHGRLTSLERMRALRERIGEESGVLPRELVLETRRELAKRAASPPAGAR